MSTQRRTRGIRQPYRILDTAEKLFGIPASKENPRERIKSLWGAAAAVWEENRTKAELARQLKIQRQALKVVVGECLNEDYSKGSRARWLCTLRSMLRINCAALAAMLYGSRPRVTLLLRLGPIELSLLSCLVQDNEGGWSTAFKPLLEKYLGPLTPLAWSDEEGWEARLGISCTRWSLSHREPYSGWDEALRYKTTWASFVERDGAHGASVFKSRDLDFHTGRRRFYRKFPAHNMFLCINCVADTKLGLLRESWSLRHFHFPLHKHPKSKRAKSFTPRRRPPLWKRPRALLSLENSMANNFDMLLPKFKDCPDLAAANDDSWRGLRFKKALK